jgi:hypothetical protein
MVRSQIVKVNGEPVEVDYMMHRNGDNWLIFDPRLRQRRRSCSRGGSASCNAGGGLRSCRRLLRD